MSPGSEEPPSDGRTAAGATAIAVVGGAPPGTHAAGDVLCERYRLVKVLRSGGMGTVWLARHLVLEIDVAIKLLLPRLSAPEFAERLMREARAAAQVNHANIVRVIDVGQTPAGEPFMAMEYLQGSSLADVIDTRGRIPAAMTVRLALPLIDALASAHAKGIVHRDLKPDNVVMTVSDAGVVVPKLVDFGIAKLADDVDEGRRLTQAGSVLGSPDYMAPEQARGERHVDGRTDVWAMCVMLYEMLTGIRPFHGDNYNALIHAIVTEEPAPTVDFGAGDEALWEILSLGLQKRAADRIGDMQALGQGLAAWALAEGITEDVMGTSLESSWLRASRTSMSFPGTARSGVPSSRPSMTAQRAVTGDSDASQLATSVRPEGLVTAPRRSRVPLVVAGVASIVLAAALWWRARPATEVRVEGPVAATSGTISASAPARPPAVVVVATAEPPASAGPSATASPPTAASAVPPAPKATVSARRPAGPSRPTSTHGSPLPVPSVPNF